MDILNKMCFRNKNFLPTPCPSELHPSLEMFILRCLLPGSLCEQLSIYPVPWSEEGRWKEKKGGKEARDKERDGGREEVEQAGRQHIYTIRGQTLSQEHSHNLLHFN